jgi:hypothetical protein
MPKGQTFSTTENLYFLDRWVAVPVLSATKKTSGVVQKRVTTRESQDNVTKRLLSQSASVTDARFAVDRRAGHVAVGGFTLDIVGVFAGDTAQTEVCG